MHADPLTNHWDRARVLITRKWDRFTDADVALINGSSDSLADRLIARYGYTRDRARTESRSFVQEFEQAGETSTEPRASALRHPAPTGQRVGDGTVGEATAGDEGTVADALEPGVRPQRGLDDGIRDAFGGGSLGV